jgi:hypothetical protein
MSLVLGADVYRNISGGLHERYDEFTCLSYIRTKIRSTDSAGSVYPDTFHGLSALYLEETFGTVTYRTMIYLYDGWVRELFCEAGLAFAPEAGVPIFEADNLNFEMTDTGLIEITLNDSSTVIYLRAGKAVLH